jgi:hypothetical protein
MTITRITDQRETPRSDTSRQYWRVEAFDGKPGWAWTGESDLASLEEVTHELARQRRRVGDKRFVALLQAPEGLRLYVERPDEDVS